MINYKKNDFVYHKQHGVGQITNITESSLLIEFINNHSDAFPLDSMSFLDKLDPKGFLSQYYQNPQHLKKLIEDKSTEVIKMLIYDEVSDDGKKINKSRIKPLLTKPRSDQQWSNNLILLDDDSWKKWWPSINRKLSKDSWFDTSDKSVIILRDEPISEAKRIYQKFVTEDSIDKKLSLCNDIICHYDRNEKKDNFDEVGQYVSDIIKDKSLNTNIKIQGILIAIQLIKKGVNVELFESDQYPLLLNSFVTTDLSKKQFQTIYSFFKQKHPANVFDFLIIYLYADDKLRQSIAKHIGKITASNKTNKDKKKDINKHNSTYSLNEENLTLLNELSLIRTEALNVDFHSLLNHLDSNTFSDLAYEILHNDKVSNKIKELVVDSLGKGNVLGAIYKVLNSINIKNDKDLKLFLYLLNALPAKHLKDFSEFNLLTVTTLKERPDIFIASLEYLISDECLHLNEDDKQALLPKINSVLSDPLLQNNIDIKNKIINIGSKLSPKVAISDALKNEELVELATNKNESIGMRVASVKLLIHRGLSKECHQVAHKIADSIEEDDIALLELILRNFLDGHLVEELVSAILSKPILNNNSFAYKFKTLLFNASITDSLFEFLIFKADSNWLEKHHELIKIFMKDEELIKALVVFGINKVDGKQNYYLDRLYSYFHSSNQMILDCVRPHLLETKATSEKAISDLIKEHNDEINNMRDLHDSAINNAISTTSRRYEQYLSNIVNIMNNLMVLREEVAKVDMIDDYTQLKELILTITSRMAEDMEGIISALNFDSKKGT